MHRALSEWQWTHGIDLKVSPGNSAFLLLATLGHSGPVSGAYNLSWYLTYLPVLNRSPSCVCFSTGIA